MYSNHQMVPSSYLGTYGSRVNIAKGLEEEWRFSCRSRSLEDII